MKSDTPSYHGYRFPPEIISYAVWLYHRFCMSFRGSTRHHGSSSVQSRRDRRAAKRFFRKLLKLKGQGSVPRRLVTDKLRSYPAALRSVMPSVIHSTKQYENNRAEVSHQPTRQRERQMRKFKSPGQAQRFLSVHGLVQTLFRVGRQLLQARHHRELRGRAFLAWDAVTCAA